MTHISHLMTPLSSIILAFLLDSTYVANLLCVCIECEV